MTKHVAAPKDRSYLESLNLKQLQKDRKPAEDQDKREFYQELQDLAKSGPLFDVDTLSLVEELPELPKHVAKWLANLSAKGSRDIDPRGLNLIVDWANGDPESSKIQSMTWDQAMEAQKAWHESTFEVHDTGTYNTKDVVQDLGGGWTMVQIDNEHDLDVEGDLMGHCVGGEDYWEAVQSGESTIYSLRDPQNKPHVTIEVSKGRVQQCYGKQNVAPVKKYNPYLIKFFEKQNLLDGILHLDDTSGVSATTWVTLAQHSNNRIRARAAHNPSTPKEVLTALAKDPAVDVRYDVARNKATPVDALKLLAKDQSWYVRTTVAANPSTPEDVLELLAKDSDPGVRAGVVRNPSVTVKLLERLAKDPASGVRRAVAMLPAVPAHILAILANDSSWLVVDKVAGNTATPASVLRQLAQNPDKEIRHVVILNESTPVDALELLTADRDAGVRSAARMALKSRGITTAALKDRSYLESLNLKQLQKDRKPAEDQDKRDFYQELQDLAKSGPMFSTSVLEEVEHMQELPKPLTKWLGNLARDPKEFSKVNAVDLNRLVMWATESNQAATRLPKLTWDAAVDAADDWATYGDDRSGKFEKNKVVYKFGDGWRIVELETEDDIILEGRLVQNCLRDPYHGWYEEVALGSVKLYSLRSPTNDPRVDIEVRGHDVQQVYGKQNLTPHRKYNPYLVEFFTSQGLDNGLMKLDLEGGISTDMWRRILSTASVDVRKSVAFRSDDVPDEIRVELAHDPDASVRTELAGSRFTPVEALRILVNDHDTDVKANVAYHKKATPDMFVKLATDDSPEVRQAVAEQQRAPVDVLNQLTQDKISYVRASAKRTLRSLG